MCSGGVEEFRHSLPVIHQARLPILQMGLFAIFAGFMYNDFFGMASFDFFGSRFDMPDAQGWMQPKATFNKENDANFETDTSTGSWMDMSKQFKSGPYPFGLDPAWHGSSNELLFVNSLKMKLSVLIGVMQMTLGVFLRFANAIHDSNMIDLICECIPMLIFMVCFFGYMDYMIIYKWTHVIPGSHDADAFPGANGPPGITNSLICMAMQQHDPQPLFEGANGFASMLMLFTAISVPWILGPKPFLMAAAHKSKTQKKKEKFALTKNKAVAALDDTDLEELKHFDDEDEEDHGGGHGHGGEFEFGEVMIHQIIETIEYVLGTVSHTVSYFRIWALSLAHQQLSLVFYSKTLTMGMAIQNPVIAGLVLW